MSHPVSRGLWAHWSALPGVVQVAVPPVVAALATGEATWIVVAVFVGVVASKAASDPTDDLTPVQTAKRAYVRGEIDEAELERRLALRLDDRRQKVRQHVEQVNGVGPATSAEIAMEFECLAELRSASRRELERVTGVGPDRAEAIHGRF